MDSILHKIKSQYIIRIVFSYIDYENKNFSLKLFNHSKIFQKKLGMGLCNYQEKFFKEKGVLLPKYLSFKNNTKQYYNLKKYDKEILKKNLKNVLSKNKFDEKDLLQYLINYYDNLFQNKDILKEDENIIDIYSPFFEVLSKEKFFKDLFIIPINIKNIKQYKLKDDYISAFKQLNSVYPKLNLTYSDINDINYLNDLEINFNLIESLIIEPEDDNYIYNNNSIFNAIFSLPNLKDNLIYLEVKGTIKEYSKYNFNDGSIPDDNDQDKINDFKSLKVLKLTNFEFNNVLTLRISNLEELYLNNCKTIAFTDDACPNLKKLSLISNTIQSDIKIKCPVLNELQFYGDYCNILDYNSLTKLKNLFIEYCDIDKYTVSPLEYVSFERSNFKIEKENLRKLISVKTLSKIKIKLSEINDNEIAKIEDKNYSVEELNIICYNQKTDCEIYNLQSKFPNLSDLIIDGKNIYGQTGFSELEIVENQNLNVNKISLTGQNKIFKFYIQSFEKLKYLSLNFTNEIKNIEEVIPFFNDKCSILFNSLTHFEFKYNTRSLEIKTKNTELLKNLYNNIDKIPNIRNFILSCSSKGIDEDFYVKLIKKLLLYKLNRIEINVQNDENFNYNIFYSRDELKQMCPYLYFGIQNISIYKLKK